MLLSIHDLARYLLFFPSVNFNALATEIFPWALVFYSLHHLKISTRQLFLVVIFLSWTIVGFLFKPSFEVVTTLLSYLNPLLVFWFLLGSQTDTVRKVNDISRIVFKGLILLGLMQLLGILTWADFLFDLLISRGGAEQFGGGRGVSLLTTEPSRAGVEVVFIYAMFRLGLKSRYTLYLLDFFMVFFILFAIRSAVSLGFLLILLGYHRPILITILGISSISFILGISDIRAIQVVSNIFSASDVNAAFNYVLNQSGFRIITVYAAYLHGLNNLLGTGIGSWSYQMVEALKNTNFAADDISYFRIYHESVFVALKPPSWLSLIFLEMGFLTGTVFFLYILAFVVKALRSRKEIGGMCLIFFFYVTLMGAVGNPIPWIAMAVSYRWLGTKDKQCS